MNRLMKKVYKLFSSPNINMKKDYHLARKIQRFMAPSSSERYDTLDFLMPSKNFTHQIPGRVFHPKKFKGGAILYFHGGGWVIGNIDSYTPTCMNLANETGRLVLSIDYRLAPEFPFPEGFNDCYHVTRLAMEHEVIREQCGSDVILMGDSAGANLAAAVSLKLRDKGLPLPDKQILIYPSTYWDHSIHSPFESIRENGKSYGLTSERIQQYMDMYVPNAEDRKNPYVSPLMAENFSAQPMTLVISAEYDPLRDEGEAYGRKLEEAGNKVRIVRIPDAVHGFFTYPMIAKSVQETYRALRGFLENGEILK